MSVVVFTKIVCEKKKKDNELDRAHSSLLIPVIVNSFPENTEQSFSSLKLLMSSYTIENFTESPKAVAISTWPTQESTY